MPTVLAVLMQMNLTNLITKRMLTRDVEAVYLQTASAFTLLASKQIHQNFASKMGPVRW